MLPALEAAISEKATAPSAEEDAGSSADCAFLPLSRRLSGSLDSLDKRDIGELKSFTKPPPLVMLSLEAVCVILGEKTDWESCRKVVIDTGTPPSRETPSAASATRTTRRISKAKGAGGMGGFGGEGGRVLRLPQPPHEFGQRQHSSGCAEKA